MPNYISNLNPNPVNGLGVEDLLLSQSLTTVQQTRGNLVVPVTPLNAHSIPYGDSDKSIAEMIEDTTNINAEFNLFKNETTAEIARVEAETASNLLAVNNTLIGNINGLNGLLDQQVASIFKEMRTINAKRDEKEVQTDSRLCALEKIGYLSTKFDTHLGDLQRIDAGTRLDAVEPAISNLKCKGLATNAVFSALVDAIGDGTLSLVDGASKDVLLVALNRAKETECQE
jgi:hypothetical protein